MAPTPPPYTLVWVTLLLATGGLGWLLGLPGIVPVLAAVLAALSVPAAIGHDIWYARRVRRALARVAQARASRRATGVPDPETERLLRRAGAMLDHLRAQQLGDGDSSDLLNILEMTIAGLSDLAEAERRRPAASRGDTLELRAELLKGLEGIEAQLRAGAKTLGASHEVELETLLTRAISARHRAEQLV